MPIDFNVIQEKRGHYITSSERKVKDLKLENLKPTKYDLIILERGLA